MARLKKTSAVLETAHQRLAGLKSFKEPPNFGPNLTVAGYEAKEKSVSAKLEAYNQSLAMSDRLQNEFQAEEAELNDLNRRFLSPAKRTMAPTAVSTRCSVASARANANAQHEKAAPAAANRQHRNQPPRFPVRWRPTRNLHRGSLGLGTL